MSTPTTPRFSTRLFSQATHPVCTDVILVPNWARVCEVDGVLVSIQHERETINGEHSESISFRFLTDKGLHRRGLRISGSFVQADLDSITADDVREVLAAVRARGVNPISRNADTEKSLQDRQEVLRYIDGVAVHDTARVCPVCANQGELRYTEVPPSVRTYVGAGGDYNDHFGPTRDYECHDCGTAFTLTDWERP